MENLTIAFAADVKVVGAPAAAALTTMATVMAVFAPAAAAGLAGGAKPQAPVPRDESKNE